MEAPTRGIPAREAAELVIGAVVDPGGVPRAKVVPAARADRFAADGMGAAVSWNVFCADDQLAFTPEFSVVYSYGVDLGRSDYGYYYYTSDDERTSKRAGRSRGKSKQAG